MSSGNPPPDLHALLDNGSWVRDLVRGLLYDKSLTDDVVQEVWIAALRKPPRAPGALRTWLYHVAQKLAFQTNRSESRRRRREQNPPDRIPAPSADEMAQAFELRRSLEELVLSLEEPYRTVVYLRYFEGLAPSEVATRLSVNESTVRTHLSRAIERLRERLDGRYRTRGHWQALFLLLLLPGALRAGWLEPLPPRAAGPRAIPVRTLRPTLAAALCLVGLLCTLFVIVRPREAPAASDATRSSPVATLRPGGGLPVSTARRTDEATAIPVPAVQVAARVAPRPRLRIVDAGTGDPVPGARAHASLRTEERSRLLGLSDAAGELEVDAEVLRREALQILAEGYRERRDSARLRDLESGTVVIDLEPVAEAEVIVLDAEGAPVEGARVTIHARVRGQDTPPPIERHTGPDGTATYLHVHENTWVEISAPGRAGRTLLASPPVTRARLAEGAPAWIRILGATGAPVAGARVEVTSKVSRIEPTLHLSAADGSASLGDVLRGEELTVTIRAPGHAPFRATGAPGEMPWELRLPEPWTLRGRIRCPEGTRAAEATALVLAPRNALAQGPGEQPAQVRAPALPERGRAARQLQPLARCKVAEDGTFAVGPLGDETEPLYLLIAHPLLRDHLERVRSGDLERAREIELTRGTTISGRVVGPDGEGREGVLLHLGEVWSREIEGVLGRTRSGPGGVFRFTGAPERLEENLPGDDLEGAPRQRTALFVTAFAPDLLLSRTPELDEMPPDQKSVPVLPGESGLVLLSARDSAVVSVDLRLRDDLDRPVLGWIPAVLCLPGGPVARGGLAGHRSPRLFAEATLEVGDGSGAEVLLLPPGCLWTAFSLGSPRPGDVVEAVLKRRPASSGATRFTLPDGTPLRERNIAFEPFLGHVRERVLVTLGATDARGDLEVGFLGRGRYRLAASREAARDPQRTPGELIPSDQLDSWLDLGALELGAEGAAEVRLLVVP